MKRSIRALLAIAVLLVGAINGTGSGQAQRTNILLIVSDDLGYADIGAYGGKDIPTSNIDRIAREGIRFTNAYVSGPYCSPSDLSEAGLYNLAEDIGETRNRAADRPDKVKELGELWQQWNRQLSKPLWSPRPGRGGA